MRPFQPALACPFWQRTPHRNRPVARQRLGSSDSPAQQQERLTCMRIAPTRRQAFSFRFSFAGECPPGLRQDSSRRRRSVSLDGTFECVQLHVRYKRYSASLFLFPGSKVRLPRHGLLAWCRGNCLYLGLFGLLDFPITSLLAFGHFALLLFDSDLTPIPTVRSAQDAAEVRSSEFMARSRASITIWVSMSL